MPPHLTLARFVTFAVMAASALAAGCSSSTDQMRVALATPVAAKALDPADPTDRSQYRYLYAVYCNGRVDRLDLKNQAKTGSFQLSDGSSKPPAVPPQSAGTSVTDSCLFSVHKPDGDLRTQLTQQARAYAGGESLEDLRAEETSAGRVLLSYRLPGADGLGFALSDRERALTVPLQALPGQSLAPGWRLAPGGRYVLLTLNKLVPVERGLQQLAATGEMRLYDAQGRQLATLNDARVAGPSMVLMPKEDMDRDTPRTAGHWLNIALTPDGLAVFADPLGNYHFVELGHVFGLDPVVGLDADDYDSRLPGLVYAAQ